MNASADDRNGTGPSGGAFALLGELVAIVIVSITLVCAAIGSLPGTPESTWFTRTSALLRTGFTLGFSDARWAYPSAFAVIFKATAITVAIVGATALLLIAIGVPLGVLSATRSRSVIVRAMRQSISSVSSLPVLIIGTLFYVVAGRVFHFTLREDYSIVAAVLAAIAALTFGDRLLADIAQRADLATRAVLAEPYMRAVRAGNFGVRRHLLQSLVSPVAEAVAARSMFLISGAIVAELIFTVHGLGYTVEHTIAVNDGRNDFTQVLAASMALIALGLCFRIARWGAVMLADPRRRG